jgi:hypothetical protein
MIKDILLISSFSLKKPTVTFKIKQPPLLDNEENCKVLRCTSLVNRRLVIEEPCDTNSVPTRGATGLGPQDYLTSRPGARRPFPSLVVEKTRDANLFVCTRVSHFLGALCLYFEEEEDSFPKRANQE